MHARHRGAPPQGVGPTREEIPCAPEDGWNPVWLPWEEPMVFVACPRNVASERGTKLAAWGWKPSHGASPGNAALVNARCA